MQPFASLGGGASAAHASVGGHRGRHRFPVLTAENPRRQFIEPEPLNEGGSRAPVGSPIVFLICELGCGVVRDLDAHCLRQGCSGAVREDIRYFAQTAFKSVSPAAWRSGW